MQEQTAPVVVLYADITGSTRLYDMLGNDAAKEIIGACISVLSDVAATHRGKVVKTIGDEIMCTFPTAADAAMAAGDMHQGIRNAIQSGKIGYDAVRITVGMHLGPIIEQQGDIFGDTVNVAARMVKAAKPDQTLTTGRTVDELPRELRNATRFFDKATVRGRQEQIEIHELIWEVSGLTQMAPTKPTAPRITHSSLMLEFCGATFELTKDNPTITMGRGEDVDIVVNTALASRSHARIDYQRGRFVLTDQSANGTYVVDKGARILTVRRDKHTLNGSGKISLGESPETNVDLLIQYRCE